ncbi:uncharacterized protein LOC103186733 [Callorhinchus milii]|uniref:uncharacterized protein LOC103186733 n=1 Tax=Callorhinchus milii TaxID=7868 RepID=UPI001C3F66C6|nr:uncharacterized protein LOC103186733 [Callorhinchus milii]
MTHVSRTSKGPDLQLCVTRKRQFCEVPPGFHQRKHEVDVPPMPKRRMCKDLPLQDEEIKVGDNIEIKLSSKNIQNRKELQSTSQSMEPMALTTPKSCVNTRYLTHKISRFSSSEVQRNSDIPLTPQIPALPKYTSEESTVSPLISDSPKIACANMRTHSCSGSQLTHFLTVTHNCQSKQIIYPIKHKSPSLRSCNPSQSVLYEETAFDSFESKGQTIDTYGRIRKQQLELPQGAENNLTEQKMKRNNSSCRQHQKIHNPCEILSSHLIDTPIKSNIFPVQPSLSSQAHTSFDSPLCEQFDVSIHSSTVRSADNPQNLHLQPTIHESSIFPILHSGTSSPDGIISSEITSIGSAPTASSTSKEHECADVSKNPLLQSKTQVTRDSSKIASNIEQLSSVSLQTTNKPAITDGMMRPHSPIQIRIPVQFIGFGTNSHLTSHSLIKPSFRTQKKSRWDCCQ